MSVYLDTSVLVPLFVEDTHADRVRSWAASGLPVVISDWSATEFSSALSHLLRLGRLNQVERDAIERAFDRWLSRRTSLVIDRQLFQDARQVMRRNRRVRAPDALHIAVASHFGLALATLDADMGEAAMAEGLEALQP